MPGVDGWSVLSQLKAMPGMEDVPIILLTMLENKEMGFALGAAEYLTKPIDASKLLPILDRHRSTKPSGTVLVVEDDPPPGNCRPDAAKGGINVRESSNGREAIEVLQSGVKPDLIVLDLIMAEMDGFDFLRQVRPHPEWSKIPVVVVSSLDLNSEAQELLRGQVEHIFKKGDSPEKTCSGGPGNHQSAHVETAKRLPKSRTEIVLTPAHPACTMAKLLIVEDNEMNRDMLSRRLQRRGFVTLIATDGSRGWRRPARNTLISY